MRDALVAGGNQTINYNYYVALIGRNDAQNPAPGQASRLLISAIEAAYTLTGERKAEALAVIIPAANLVAPERVRGLANEAEAAALSVEDARSRMATLAVVAGVVAAVNPRRGEALARLIEEASLRGKTLTEVARVVELVDPERASELAADAEAITGPVEDRGPEMITRARDAWRLARDGHPEATENLAQSIEDVSLQGEALTQAAGEVAKTDPARAAAIARSVKDVSLQEKVLVEVVRVTARLGNPTKALGIAWSFEDASLQGKALAEVAGEVAKTDRVRAIAIARSVEDASWQAVVLAVVAGVIAPVAPGQAGGLVTEAEDAARSVEDTRARSAALAEVAGIVAAVNPERAEAIALSVQDASQRAGALAALVHLLIGGARNR
jgi:hypothetical protein